MEIHIFGPSMSLSKKYIRFILAFGFWITLCWCCFSQQRNNPFEIKQRLHSLPKNDTAVAKIDVSPSSMGIKSIGEASIPDTSKIAITNPSKNVNPFEVDHVPIRRISGNMLKDNFNEQDKRKQNSNGVLLGFLMLSCALLAIVINIKSKALGIISKSIVNENMFKLLYREESTKFSPYLIFLFVIFCVNLAVFIFLVSKYFGGRSNIISFYIILGIVFLFIL
ncbi:MAG: DUF4271 domain-containing protein [Saprospiraceae bacterium]|nr:DUF4271 domain-containing protein [Saprospiraceae bacterium]